MKEIGLDELKKIELDMLVFIDQFCRDNSLRYYLCGGTLLGAVRHKGFIPWDDDIDIFMPRPDYEKAIVLLKDSKKYHLMSSSDTGYYYNWGKLVDRRTILNEQGIESIDDMGVYIDIFPLDGMPCSKEECEDHFKLLDRQRKIVASFSIGRPHFRKNLYCYFSNWIQYIVNKDRDVCSEQKKYLDLAMRYAYDESENVYATGGAYKEKDIFPQNWVSDGISLEFEGRNFKVPLEYDKYLKQLYGDYMILPPKEKQISHHKFKAYWKD